MSYVVHPGQASETEANASWPITPMLYDIQAAQKLYGANLTTRTGDTNYIGGSAAVYRLGDGGVLTNGRIGILTIYDAGGIDTIDASIQTGAVRIDLNPGAFSTIGPVANNVAVAYAVKSGGVIVNYIENAKGGSGADTLVGNATHNVLAGNAGNDTLEGGAGNDTLVGGGGTDRLVGGPGNDTYVNPAGDTIVEADGGGTDTVETNLSFSLAGLPFVERITLTGASNANATGNAANNVLTGNAGNNLLRGGEGNDNIKGNGGNDIIAGEGGNDTLSGGDGADTFRFAPAGSGIDRILDFNIAEDRFDLGGTLFTGRSHSGGNTTLTYSGGTIVVVGITGHTLGEWNNLAQSAAGHDVLPFAAPIFGSDSHIGDYIGV
jgi:serralysin